MYLVAIAWIYVVLMMAIAEAMAPNGTLLGAGVTFVLYGLLPLGIVLYVMGAPMRRRARRAAEAQADEAAARAAEVPAPGSAAGGDDPRTGGHAPGDAIAAERKEV